MKTKNLFSMALLALCVAGCQSVEDEMAFDGNVIVGASMEDVPLSKVAISDGGVFSWSEGDEIGIYTNSKTWSKFTLQGEGGSGYAQFTGVLVGKVVEGAVAVYPYNKEHTPTMFVLPSSYTYDELEKLNNVNVAMMADIENPSDLSRLPFKHLGGAFRITIEDIPAGVSRFILSTNNTSLTGKFEIGADTDRSKIISADNVTDGGNSVTINFPALETQTTLTFTVPAPTGTYQAPINIKLQGEKQDGEGNYVTENVLDVDVTSGENTLKRKDLAILYSIDMDSSVGGELEGWYNVTPETITDVLKAAPNNSNLVLALAEGTYNLHDPNWSARYKTLTFVGTNGNAANTIIRCDDDLTHGTLVSSKVTFENLTVETDNGYPRGFQHVVGATYKNCIIKNQLTLYNDGKEGIITPLTFENCRFEASGNNYNLWTWGVKEATFTNCIFNCDGKSVLVYNSDATLTFNNCTFNDNGGQDGKAAIETGIDGDATKYVININGCTVNGFDVNSVSGSNIWGNKDSMTADKLNVFNVSSI